MKNVFIASKKVMVMVAIMATVAGYANETVNSTIKDAKKTAIVLKNVKQGNLLSIKDSNGIVLYKESIEKEGVYAKGFDLSALPNGNYAFELEKDVEIRWIPFEVAESKVILSKENEVKYFKPVTRIKDGLVYVSKLALGEEALNINVYRKDTTTVSRDYELVFSETIESVKHMERIFKLSEKGNYKIVYSSKGRIFTEYINN